MPSRPLRHAVVAGGSIAGLLATRVLSDHFERVTLVERDALAHTPQPRKGVPQGAHAHILLLRGQVILRAMLPGLPQELCQARSCPL
jgi:2-polyprenyl-6-methoxyphenol hydroxylase-like FAD-dependent oxidoreductase